MAVEEHKIITKLLDVEGLRDIQVYKAHGGYEALEKALKTGPDEVIQEVQDSGLSGRGGAWFSTGMKWSFMPKEPAVPSYLCVNADESEPGTFKDRKLLRGNPHQLLEGTIIASYAIRASAAYIYVRGEMWEEMVQMEEVIAQAREAGYVGKNILGSGYDLEVYTHPGAGAYICGEETGLMQSLEGHRAQPRVKPPFPAQKGIFGCPTTVNNVQTLSYVPHIINNGAEWFKGIGSEQYPGSFIFCVSGHVKNPGIFELECGSATMREIIFDLAGGLYDGRKLKAVIPGGASTSPMTPDQIDIVMDPANFALPGRGEFQGMFGTGGIIVMDDTACMVDALLNLMNFFAHESCGQCTPCREGCPWTRDIVWRIEHGQGKPGDLDTLLELADQVAGFLSPRYSTICLFGPAFSYPITGFVQTFRAEFEAHIEQHGCPIRQDKSVKVPA
ncbi:MAG: NADH-quinone oxidoreductase subunit NuoF [Candidatus Latescibacteria bacterium]|jgi:NADH-quinone oxidoreductase subunit F|nr:NADH-quinone oxidoreductase subunit NuoF [Candidatus Latescibacterota bacterium]